MTEEQFKYMNSIQNISKIEQLLNITKEFKISGDEACGILGEYRNIKQRPYCESCEE